MGGDVAFGVPEGVLGGGGEVIEEGEVEGEGGEEGVDGGGLGCGGGVEDGL